MAHTTLVDAKKEFVSITRHDDSCYDFQLQDEQGNKIDLPAEIEKIFNCPLISPILSPDQNIVLFFDGRSYKLKSFNLTTKKQTTVFTTYDSLQELWRVGSPGKTKHAFIVFDQARYGTKLKIFILSFEEGKLKKKKTLLKEIEFHCPNGCSFQNDDAVTFKDEQTFVYKESKDWDRYYYVEDREAPVKIKTIKLAK